MYIFHSVEKLFFAIVFFHLKKKDKKKRPKGKEKEIGKEGPNPEATQVPEQRQMTCIFIYFLLPLSTYVCIYFLLFVFGFLCLYTKRAW